MQFAGDHFPEVLEIFNLSGCSHLPSAHHFGPLARNLVFHLFNYIVLGLKLGKNKINLSGMKFKKAQKFNNQDK